MEIKKGDLMPNLEVNLMMTDPADVTGETLIPIPSLDTASSVSMDMRHKESGTVVVQNATCVVVDPVTALVRHQWATGETDIVGKYDVEFEVTWPSSRPQTVPSKKFYTVEVTDTID